MTSSAAPAEASLPATRPPRSTADLVVTGLLLLAGAVLGAFASVLGLMLVMGSDSCGVAADCSVLGITAGVGTAVVGPWVGLLALGVWAVVRLVRRRRAWWVALVALLSVPALWFAGAALVWFSVRPAA